LLAVFKGARVPKITKRILDAITRELVKATSKMGTEVFQRSQTYVPVRTGNLRSSGIYTATNDGFEIQYLAPYAGDVEFGTSGGNVQPHVSVIKGHRRKTKTKGNVPVRAHKKTYRTGKPVYNAMSQEWSTINLTETRPPSLFLTRALREVLNQKFKVQNGLQGDIQAKI